MHVHARPRACALQKPNRAKTSYATTASASLLLPSPPALSVRHRAHHAHAPHPLTAPQIINGGSSLAAAAAAAEGLHMGGGASPSGGGGWGPFGPGGTCPPSCIDLSAFAAYLGGSTTCTCNAIGGMFSADPHAAAAACHLVCVIVGMGLMYASLSWLVIDVACQAAHTQVGWGGGEGEGAGEAGG